MQNVSRNKYLISFLFFISPLIALTGVINPFFAPAASLVSGSLMGVVLTFVPVYWILIPAVVVFLAALKLTASYYMAAFAVLLFVPSSVCLAIAFKKRFKLNQSVAMTTITYVTGMAALGGAFLYLRGGALNNERILAIFAPINNYMNLFLQNTINSLQSIPSQNPADIKRVADILVEFKDIFNNMVLPLLPGFIASYILMISFFSFLLAKVILKGLDFDTAYIDKIDSVRISKPAGVVFILAYLGNIALPGIYGLALANFAVVMELVFACSGISVIYYLLARKKSKPIKALILSALLIINFLPLQCGIFFSITGVFDTFLNYRRFPERNQKNKEE